MKKSSILLIAVIAVVFLQNALMQTSAYHQIKPTLPNNNEQKNSTKKIIIFTSPGGRGHLEVTKALSTYLENDYIIQTTNVFKEVLGLNGEEGLYNLIAQKKWFGVLNGIAWAGKQYFTVFSKKNETLITKYLKKNNADMIISVIPLINNEILSAAKTLDIPFLLIPTDLDTHIFVKRIKEPQYDKFRLALSFADDSIKKIVDQAQIPAHQIILTGIPLKPDFFERKNRTAIKKQLNVPSEKPVILLLMGGLGSEATFIFSKELAKIKTPAHLFICLGKNETMRSRINQLTFPSHITYNVIGFTERISDLLAISDLFITKSGSVSICEGIHMHVPMVLDATTTVLSGEQFNHGFIEEHGFGCSAKKRKELSTVVDNLLADPNRLNTMKKNLVLFKQNQKNEALIELIKQMTSH